LFLSPWNLLWGVFFPPFFLAAAQIRFCEAPRWWTLPLSFGSLPTTPLSGEFVSSRFLISFPCSSCAASLRPALAASYPAAWSFVPLSWPRRSPPPHRRLVAPRGEALPFCFMYQACSPPCRRLPVSIRSLAQGLLFSFSGFHGSTFFL